MKLREPLMTRAFANCVCVHDSSNAIYSTDQVRSLIRCQGRPRQCGRTLLRSDRAAKNSDRPHGWQPLSQSQRPGASSRNVRQATATGTVNQWRLAKLHRGRQQEFSQVIFGPVALIRVLPRLPFKRFLL
jgi:hypothetical protein